MQPPRLILRRLLARRPLKAPGSPTNARLFTRNTNLASTSRPQLPFLNVPIAKNQQFRYLTTERKRWLAYEMMLGAKYTVYGWAIIGFSVVAYWSVQQEWLERKYPTPHEWAFITRMRMRLAKWAPNRTDIVEVDWLQVANFAKNVIERLEDPKIDGAGVEDLTEGGVWIDGVGKSGYDVTAKTEHWRRGYYEALMLCAKAAENLNDQVTDRTRRLYFPADQMIGPSNPNPKPIPPGSPSAPREEDCEPAFEDPETFYLRILTTRGFTPKQKMDAALACASWLDFKQVPEAAERMYQWALAHSVETSETPLSAPPTVPYDQKTYVLRDGASLPSTNLLTALTAVATHKARYEDVATALPILISILRARRSLPNPTPSSQDDHLATSSPEIPSSPWTPENMVGTVKRIIFPPEYPPAPDSGETPPTRGPKELCEEAGLNLYIGEIIYASEKNRSKSSSFFSSPTSSREEGIAWTREAVDLAEEQLHKLNNPTGNGDDAKSKAKSSSSSKTTTNNNQTKNKSGPAAEARATCRECLTTGLDNWAKMTAKLAREEKEAELKARGAHPAIPTTVSQSSSSWFPSLWGSSSTPESTASYASSSSSLPSSTIAGTTAATTGGRWAAEVNVVKERTRRAQEVLEELEKPGTGLGSLLSV